MIMALTWLISQLVIVTLRSVRGILGTDPGPARVSGARQRGGSKGGGWGGRVPAPSTI